MIYQKFISHFPGSSSSVPDVNQPTPVVDSVDTKDLVHNSTMAEIKEVIIDDASDTKPSFIVCQKKKYLELTIEFRL